MVQRRSNGSPTYYYSFARVVPRFLDDPKSQSGEGAVHSAEIEYALGNLNASPIYSWTDIDRTVSATMSAYWANLIKFR